MSISLMSQVWDSKVIQDSSTLLVMLALAYFASDDGVLWTSFPSMASNCRISERQFKRIIKSLERAGAIEVGRLVGTYPTVTHSFKVTL